MSNNEFLVVVYASFIAVALNDLMNEVSGCRAFIGKTIASGVVLFVLTTVMSFLSAMV